MSKVGSCCCTCECLPVEDLPTLSISGWVAGSWSGSSCCFSIEFTPYVTPAWSKSCSSDIYNATFLEECETFHFELLNNMRTSYRKFPFSCDDLADDYCCPGSLEHVSTTNTTWNAASSAFMAVWRRPKKIIVRVSREDVDCEGIEGQTSGCKIVVRTRYIYEYAANIFTSSSSSVEQTVTLLNSDCFTTNSAFEVSISTNNTIACEELSDTPGITSCSQSGEFYFDRVRYFDTMPTGSIQFNNSHVPGCDASGCDYSPFNYGTQVCIQSPAEPINLGGPCDIDQPCGCDGVTEESESYVIEDFVCSGGFFSVVDGCDDPGEFPACTTILQDCNGAVDHVCAGSGWTASRLGFAKSGCNSFVGASGVGYPIQTLDPVTPKYNGCGAYGAVGLPGGALFIPKPHIFLDACSGDPCNLDCCEVAFDCPACGIDDCTSKYAGASSASINEHTVTRNCSGFSSQSVCTSAPTWTITFSE